ncbi:ATP synthase subunit beta [Mesorhizobium sp. L-8-10]|uniref:class I SAM-dependent methyltransferase n=1 Tax=Mesorhizobium sp. L-8-10 TaxID=2744523 RepID=UPI001927A48E|nr:class I SAM-dependent methyltransferase [Mesorhizobium sp. L-8-10]BCH31460.1 ATP synthase subunit beta [Mesorhizobium sp. L-8-10]
MTQRSLRRRILDLIEAQGPLSVADYMTLCLYDRKEGYYMSREPFGRGGDFTTAPEVSQMFGELVGAWIVSAWQAVDRPSPAMIVEIGPGRGTLMKDMERTLRRIAPQLHEAARFELIEVSPRLARIQAETLATSSGPFDWHDDIDALPSLPLFIVGNELFDAVPIRQYVRTESGWRERCVGADGNGNLAFLAGAGSLDASLLPAAAAEAAPGTIVEVAPSRSALMQKIAERIAGDGGAGLFFDYGYLEPATGDSFQALRRHAFTDPLAEPGKADLTAHVDFAALADAVRAAGLVAGLATQGGFLLRMGLLERAGRLGADADEAGRERISGEVERLAGPDQMGSLFKVMAVARQELSLPPFSSPD